MINTEKNARSPENTIVLDVGIKEDIGTEHIIQGDAGKFHLIKKPVFCCFPYIIQSEISRLQMSNIDKVKSQTSCMVPKKLQKKIGGVWNLVG